MKNSHHNDESVLMQTRQHHGSTQSLKNYRNSKYPFRNDMSSMEIGVYVLLTAFCFAIVVFVISCVVYASKFRPRAIDTGPLELSKAIIAPNMLSKELRFPKESTTNVHDWVWLGRSTMDRSSLINDSTSNNDNRGKFIFILFENSIFLTGDLLITQNRKLGAGDTYACDAHLIYVDIDIGITNSILLNCH